jgi:hypothetical protein
MAWEIWGKPDARRGLKNTRLATIARFANDLAPIWNIDGAVSRQVFTRRRSRCKNSYAGILASDGVLLKK